MLSYDEPRAARAGAWPRVDGAVQGATDICAMAGTAWVI